MAGAKPHGTMSKLATLFLCVGLTGCSVALGSGPKRPAAAVADGMVAAGLLAAGIAETRVTCSDSQWLCLSSIDHQIGGIAIATAAMFALSALYGAARPEPPADTRAADLSNHALIAAHAGRCGDAADSASRLHAIDRNAYERLLGDDAIHGCLH